MLHSTAITIDELPHLVSDYNARKHRTIGMRFADIIPAIAERLLNMMYSAIKIANPVKFKMSDSVRVSKMIFEKGYTPNWTIEFTIVKVQCTKLVTYLLEDYREKSAEAFFMSTSCIALLIRTCISWRKYCTGKEIRCTSSGWDSHNSWIHKNNVIW